MREKQKPPAEKIISVLFLRAPFPIWGAAVRSGRQAPLFVLAAGGRQRGGGMRGIILLLQCSRLDAFSLMISWPPACAAAPSTPVL